MAKTIEELAKERGFTGEVQKDIKKQEVQEDTTPEEQKEMQRAQKIIKTLPVVLFAMDFLKDPEAALIKWLPLQNEYHDRWFKAHWEHIFSLVAEQTGITPEQMADPKKRTPEQKELITKAEQNQTKEHIQAFYGSLYMNSLRFLIPIEGKYKDPDEMDLFDEGSRDKFIDVKEQAVLYFFALHRDLEPTQKGTPDKDQQKELKKIFGKLDRFYLKNAEQAKGRGPEVFFSFIEKENPPQSKRAKAESENALTTIGQRLFVPSDPVYRDAFITSTSKTGLFYKREDGTKQLALDINTGFLRALAKAVLIDIYSGEPSDKIAMYLPDIAKELGYDINYRTLEKKGEKKDTKKETKNGEEKPRKKKALPIRAKAREEFVNKIITELDHIWGKLPDDDTEYRVISTLAYNPKTETLYFVSPYFQQLTKALVTKERKNTARPYYWKSDLLHAKAASNRNQAAVEMAARILVGLAERGIKPDAELKQNRHKRYKDKKAVTWRISFNGLINDCPQIREKLKGMPEAGRRTQLLKRYFAAMYKTLRTESDLFTYYADLTITEILPTSKTLDMEIVIKHHGTNPDYKAPLLPYKG